MSLKLYVIVRRDLSTSHQAVQAGHALAQLLLTKKIGWKNGTLVYLSVRDEETLRKLFDKLPCKNKAFFEEPYWQNQMTAIAAYGIKLPHYLRKFSLL
jgi:uncharacterized protein (DUF1919 family)